MGYSNVDLANRALDHLGREHIASMTEASTAARRINDVFEATVHEALEWAPWTFARSIRALAQVTNDWDERWTYKYDEPGDAAKVLRLVSSYDPVGPGVPISYQRLGGAIYTNLADAKAEIVVKSLSTGSMPVSFLTAVSFLLARNVAMPLTRKSSTWRDMDALWRNYVGLASSFDASQEPASWIEEDGGAYIRARDGSTEYREW